MNLLPAFGPPTWAVLVLFRLHTGAGVVPLVAIGATAATSGRVLLAVAARRLAGRLPDARRARLEALRDRVLRHRVRSAAGLAVFLLSPLPSAQLFLAAGVLRVPLRPAAGAFLAGRLVSYSGYVGAATLVQRSYGDVATDALRSPWAIALQVVLVAAVAALPFVPHPDGPSTGSAARSAAGQDTSPGSAS